MSVQVTVPPIVWLRAVRDARPYFSDARVRVLTALALRLNEHGRGFASTAQLCGDSDKDRATVLRATQDAQDRGYLLRTRRGHRLGSGEAIANEWALILPADIVSQGRIGATLSNAPMSQGCDLDPDPMSQGCDLDDLNVAQTASQGRTGATPRGLSTRGLSLTDQVLLSPAPVDDPDPAVATSAAAPAPSSSSKGTRLPEHFETTEAMIAWAREHAPATGRRDHHAFVDYWRSVPGAKGRKVDWEATWRNWMRRAQSDADRRNPSHAPGNSRASPDGLVEVNGFRVKPETAQRMQRRARLAAMDQQQQQFAIGEAP